MTTNLNNLVRQKNLSSEILAELNVIFEQFSAFQEKSGLPCPIGCGKCCFKADIYCAPIELLPMALDLFERGEAVNYYDKCVAYSGEQCIFMEVSDLKMGKGRCTEYQFRPLVCRTFGVAGRHNKKEEINYSICTILKETHEATYKKFISLNLSNDDVMFIDDSKSRLSNIDPAFLEQEYPINISLSIILAKILFLAGLDTGPNNSNTCNL
jgi:Fe-S-cluster containining protein